MSQHSISHSLLNVMLVIAESILTLILRFDPELRRAAYPLAKKNITVRVRTYLPHTEFYATFTSKGVLLDTFLPIDHDNADVVINTYTHELLNTFVNEDIDKVNKLTMRGNVAAISEIRQFLVQLSIIGLVQRTIHNIKGKNEDDKNKKSKPDPQSNYQAQIADQKQQLNALSIRNKELEMTVKEVESKQKTMLIALAVMSLVAIIALIGWLT